MRTPTRRAVAVLAILLLLAAAAAIAMKSRDVDIVASDGVKLRATYTSPGAPGPGMLLIHQCNMDRTAWKELTGHLVDAGVHVLAMDLRGVGETPGEPFSRETFGKLMQVSPGDVDAALAFLVDQKGVDGERIGVGGASCGAMLTADLASRNDAVTTLMLLSGPPSDAAVAHIAADAGLAVFAAAASSDPITPGVADRLSGAVDDSPNEGSKAMIFDGTEHGLPMFAKNPELGPALVDWLTSQLTR
ncbi:MAG: alpha/beta hydrolase [Thermoanaerobaculia bacterium]|nr:alpha/beta hydrolase [Thermoanaerobaculia bacterium]